MGGTGKPLAKSRRALAHEAWLRDQGEVCTKCGGVAKDNNPLKTYDHAPECIWYTGVEACTCAGSYRLHERGCPPG